MVPTPWQTGGPITVANDTVIQFGTPATAFAQREWDIEAFDECVSNTYPGLPGFIAAMKECCITSGGVWDDDRLKCGAPPAEAPVQQPLPLPPAGTTAPFEPPPTNRR